MLSKPAISAFTGELSGKRYSSRCGVSQAEYDSQKAFRAHTSWSRGQSAIQASPPAARIAVIVCSVIRGAPRDAPARHIRIEVKADVFEHALPFRIGFHDRSDLLRPIDMLPNVGDLNRPAFAVLQGAKFRAMVPFRRRVLRKAVAG
jgi:hypothetical protein